MNLGPVRTSWPINLNVTLKYPVSTRFLDTRTIKAMVGTDLTTNLQDTIEQKNILLISVCSLPILGVALNSKYLKEEKWFYQGEMDFGNDFPISLFAVGRGSNWLWVSDTPLEDRHHSVGEIMMIMKKMRMMMAWRHDHGDWASMTLEMLKLRMQRSIHNWFKKRPSFLVVGDIFYLAPVSLTM